MKGKTAEAFWREALKPMLDTVEQDLAVWCALELDLGLDALRTIADSGDWSWPDEPLTTEALDNRVDADTYAKVWGQWAGREAEFFRRSAELVSRLTWSQVLDICGPRTRALADLTRDAFAKLKSDDLPATVSVGEISIVHAGPETAQVVSYSPYDPVDVPNVVLAHLHLFDGRTTEEAIDAIEAKSGVRLERALVTKLADFGVLEPGAAVQRISPTTGDAFVDSVPEINDLGGFAEGVSVTRDVRNVGPETMVLRQSNPIHLVRK